MGCLRCGSGRRPAAGGCSLRGGVLHRLDDVLVAGAAAQVAGHAGSGSLLRSGSGSPAAAGRRASACPACRSRTAGRVPCRSLPAPRAARRPARRPSTVSTSAPSHCTARWVQLLTDLPSMSTVQAPQWLVSQPMCGAGEAQFLAQEVDEQRARLDRLLDRALPLSLNADEFLRHGRGLRSAFSGARGARPAMRALDHLAGHRGLVVDVAAQVVGRVADGHRQARGLGRASRRRAPCRAARPRRRWRAARSAPTLVSAMRTWLTLPPFRRSTTAAAAVAQSPVLRLSFS